MPIIGKDDVYTQVVTFTVAPDLQDALVAAPAGEVERWVRTCPGFVSSTFHASLDRSTVLNYAQWRSHDDLETFNRDPRGEQLRAAISAVGPESGPHAIGYRVVRVIS